MSNTICERWIILNNRLMQVSRITYKTEIAAQKALDKMFENNPMAKSQFFIGEAERYNY